MSRAAIRAPSLLMLVSIIALLIASCSPAPQGGSEPAASGSSSSSSSVSTGDGPPRNRTLVITPWSDTTGPLSNAENWNIYQTGNKNQREMGSKTLYEALFYTNLNTGELVPWQAETFEYNDDFTSITVKLRDGVKWSDGTPFTCADVKFTLEMLRDNAPDLTQFLHLRTVLVTLR